jgi:hypothetical protein
MVLNENRMRLAEGGNSYRIPIQEVPIQELPVRPQWGQLSRVGGNSGVLQ